MKNSRMRPSQSRLKSDLLKPNADAEAMARRSFAKLREDISQDTASQRRVPVCGDAASVGPEELYLSARATLQRAF